MKPRYINILGAERPIYFGTNAVNIWERKREGSDLTDLENTAVMIQIGLSEGARKEGIKNAQKFTIEQIFDAFDELGVDGLKGITEAIQSFMPQGDTGEGVDRPGEAPADQ